MDKKTLFQASFFASLIGFAGILIQIVSGISLPTGVQLQPQIPMPISQFITASNDYPNKSLLFFAGDSLFILGYLLLFGGLFSVTFERARIFSIFGIFIGILGAILDATENAFFIT